MATFIDALGQTVRSGVCAYLSTYNNFNDILYGEGGLIGTIPRAAGRTAYRLLCNEEPPEEPDPLVPGGQCPVQYFYTAEFEYNGAGGSNEDWIYQTRTNEGGFAIYGAIGAMQVLQNGQELSFPTASGTDKVVLFLGGVPGRTNVRNYRFTNIRRKDGLPDNCGVVPAPIPPPTPPSETTNTSYETNNNISVNIPVNLTYAPVNIDVNGELNIPVRVNIPVDADVTFNANLSLNTGDISFNFGDSNYSPGCKNPPSSYDSPGDTPEVPPDVPVDVPPTDPDAPEPETVRLLRAAIVTVNVVPDGITEIFQDDNPNVFIPRLGNVQFLIRVGNRVAWTEEIAIKNKRQFVICPWEGGAIDVRGTPQPNVVWNIAPVYAIQEETVSFEDS